MTFDEIITAIGKKPYYQDDAVVIYNADCRKVLGLPDDREERIERALKYQEFRNANKR